MSTSIGTAACGGAQRSCEGGAEHDDRSAARGSELRFRIVAGCADCARDVADAIEKLARVRRVTISPTRSASSTTEDSCRRS